MWDDSGGLSGCVFSYCSIIASSRSKLDDPVSFSWPVVVGKYKRERVDLKR